MEPGEVAVKSTPRRYDASGRRAKAERSRTEIVDAARDLFLEQGYAATRIGAIAARAGVSAETVYKAFGGKPGLVRAVCAQALSGTGPIPAEQRSDDLQRAEKDPRAVIRGWGALTAEVAPRVVPLLLLVRDAAAHDPAMADLRVELDALRLARMRHNAQGLAAGGRLRHGVTRRTAADVLWTYSSPELYELLVLRRGWDIARYVEFIVEGMTAALIPTDG